MTVFQHPLLQKLVHTVLVLLVFLGLGLLTRPLEVPAWQTVKSRQIELNLEGVEGALGQGLVIGVLGGFRTIVADFMWLQLNHHWEKRERVKVDALIRLVTMLDPRPDFFWINGARMTAYDVPNWRIREAGGYNVVPEVRQREIDREQAEQAFALLRRALEFHPDNPKVHLEFAQIYLNRLKDFENAAQWFLSASHQENAPFYAARIHAELLRRMDKDQQAYTFLKGLFLSLPDDNPYAQKDIVLERIRELEGELGIPEMLRFLPQLDFMQRLEIE
ncbi:MAG: tetratricopeptide repeat protein [Coraliomargarita sp.]|nr:tetratricopeptide repeat protein [Coraliomargarita sp.]